MGNFNSILAHFRADFDIFEFRFPTLNKKVRHFGVFGSAGAVWYIWQKCGPQGFFTRMQPQKNTARFFDYLTEISQRILQNYRSKTMFFRHFCQNFKPNLDLNTRIDQMSNIRSSWSQCHIHGNNILKI